MAHYESVNNIARKVVKRYEPVNNVARKVVKGYESVGNVARQFFKSGNSVGSLPVGSSVYMNVGGVRTEFLVVHQGLPSSMYDASCNGTWLLMKNIYTKNIWDNSDNNYSNSSARTYLNNNFLSLFDSNIKSIIKEVRIPYVNGTGWKGTVASGSNGLLTKIFYLSAPEVNWYNLWESPHQDGDCLSYFSGMSAVDSRRVGYLNGTANLWWLRSPYHIDDTNVFLVYTDGNSSAGHHTSSYGVRPALILPSNIGIDENFNVVV